MTTPLVLAETNHLATRRAGARSAAAVRRDVAAGAYAVEWWPSAASDAIATFDERRFRALRPLGRENAFAMLPADAPQP